MVGACPKAAGLLHLRFAMTGVCGLLHLWFAVAGAICQLYKPAANLHVNLCMLMVGTCLKAAGLLHLRFAMAGLRRHTNKATPFVPSLG